MEQLRNTLATIRGALGGMTPTQKMLIGSLGVIGLMTLLLVSQYSAAPSSVAVLPGAAPEDQQAAATHLTSLGIDAELDSAGQVVVPRAVRTTAMSALAESQMLPGDASLMFETLIQNQSWQNSRSMNQQQFMIALQNELARAISGFTGIRDATVIIDDPEPSGLGRAVRPASASVAVTTRAGGLDQNTVDAIAHLVASSRARLEVDRVRVIDRSSNTQWSATDGRSMRANSYLEHKSAYESRVSEQLYAQLRYIPNVIVSVTASVDVTQVESQVTSYLPDKQGSLLNQIASEMTSSATEHGASGAAEPGLRSNTTADINASGAGSSAPSLQTDEADRSFQHFAGTEQKRIVDPRGVPTYIAATISVPEEYVTELVRQSNRASGGGDGGDGDAEPGEVDPAEVEAQFAEIKQDIIRGVFPHLRTDATPDAPTTEFLEQTVHVSMVPTGFATASILPTNQAGMPGMGGGWMAFDGGLVDTVVVALLALAALGMMIAVVRRSSRRIDLPSAEDLVGVPTALATASEVVGEVEESIRAMSATEVDDHAVEYDQVLEQVAELLKQNPEGSAKLIGRWMSAD